MKAENVRVAMLPTRAIGRDKSSFVEVASRMFPEEWKVHILTRPPLPSTGFKEHVHATDMYRDQIYKQKITEKDVSEEEKWLGVSLNTIIYMEHLYFHKNRKFKPSIESKKKIVRHIRFYRKYLKENRINFCVLGFCYPGEITDITFSYVVKRMGILYFDSGVPFILPKERRLFFFKDYQLIKYSKKHASQAAIDKLVASLQKTIRGRRFANPEIQRYVKKSYFSFATPIFKLGQFREILKNRSEHETQFNLWDFISNYLKSMTFFVVNNIALLFQVGNMNKERYFYFPLHFPRDAQITFKEPFIDQYRLVEIIAASLPHGTKLYVKSHPHFLSSDIPSAKFFRMLRCSNVRLLHYREEAHKLVDQSIGVITINSNTGLEAVALGKPLVTFGNENYSKEGIGIKVTDYKELKNVLLAITKDRNHNISEKERKQFLYDCYSNSVQFSDIFLGDKVVSEDEYKSLRDALRDVHSTLLKDANS